MQEKFQENQSADHFDDQPAGQPKLIRSVSDKSFARMVGQKFDAKNAASIKKEESMVKVHQASDSFYAELQAAAKPFAGKWVGRINGMGIDGVAMLEFYVNEVKQLQAN